MRITLSPLAVAFLVTATVVFPHTSSRADDEAKAALARMLEASESLNYEGTFVYIQGHHLEAMAISHRARDPEQEVGWQHLSALNGTPREIIVTEKDVVCLLPEKRITCQGVSQRRSPFPISLPNDLDQLEDYYHFEILGTDRTADHATQVIGIQPADDYRFGYRFWIHEDSGMVLRSALLDESGQVLEQLMFTAFTVHPAENLPEQPPLPSFLRLRAEAGTQNTSHDPLPAKDSPWKLGELPPGFRRILHHRYTDAGPANTTEHMVLSDGLATVSVFLEPLASGSEAVLEGFSRMGAMNAYGVTQAGHQIMVVGEVPELTVRTIGDALSYDD